jgi:hypothetical protein
VFENEVPRRIFGPKRDRTQRMAKENSTSNFIIKCSEHVGRYNTRIILWTGTSFNWAVDSLCCSVVTIVRSSNQGDEMGGSYITHGKMNKAETVLI